MKRVIALLVTLILLLPVFAVAVDIDLAGLSFAELVELKQQINLALWSAEEWQEVAVPQGVYEIGVDIPAGHWTIRAVEGMDTYVHWGDQLNKSGVGVSISGDIWVPVIIQSPSHPHYSPENATQVDYDLKEGQYITIEWGPAVFSPFTGKPDLGFK